MTSWRAWPWALGLSCGVVLLHLWLRQCPSEVGPVFSGISMGFPIWLSRAFRVQLDVFFLMGNPWMSWLVGIFHGFPRVLLFTCSAVQTSEVFWS
jgi:hypothetical protein